MGSKQRMIKELNRRIDKIWSDAVVDLPPSANQVVSGFVRTVVADPVTSQVDIYESIPPWGME